MLYKKPKPYLNMKGLKMEETEEYKKWAKELGSLNDRINSIKPWNSHAETLQREYDLLLQADPRLKCKQ